MKQPLYVLILTMLLSACSATKQPVCENTICTMEFRMIQVKFNDASGNPVVVKDYSAVNKRTGESTTQNNEPSTINNTGIYVVASDADVKKLTENGDVIIVTATHPTSNKKLTSEFVVAGGICACHVNKISGPSELTF